MGIYNYDRLRMGNLMPTETGSGYKLYDQFLASVLPLLNQSRAGNRRYDKGIMEDEQAFKTNERMGMEAADERQNRLKEIGDMQRQDFAERNKPMNVHIGDREITPYQKEQLRLQEKGIDVAAQKADVYGNTAEQRAALEKEKFEETKRRNLSVEDMAKNKIKIQQFEAEHPNLIKYEQPNGDTVFIDPNTRQIVMNVGPSGLLGDKAKGEQAAANAAALETQKQAGKWEDLTIDDPQDPTKKITVRRNTATGEMQRYTLDGQPIGEATKAGAKTTKQPVNIAAIRAKAQDTLNLINNHILKIDPEDPNNEKKIDLTDPVKQSVGGSRMMQRHRIEGTDAYTGNVNINTLKAKQIVDLIADMKAQSDSGATGFGQLNLRELGVLESAASRLDPGLPEPEFREAVLEIRRKLLMILADENKPYIAPGGSVTPEKARELLERARQVPVGPVRPS
jgi:hypothetical protein